jgi:hypothetical protein
MLERQAFRECETCVWYQRVHGDEGSLWHIRDENRNVFDGSRYTYFAKYIEKKGSFVVIQLFGR